MQWIKVFTDIFANPKIKILLKERDGDKFFRVWIDADVETLPKMSDERGNFIEVDQGLRGQIDPIGSCA